MLKNSSRFLTGLITMAWLMLLIGSADAAPQVTSKYYCLIDAKSGQVLLANNDEVRRPVASTTKIMTAVLAEEYAGLNELASVSKHADHTAEYTIGLREGQKLPVAELIKVALIRSANDSAVVLAEHVAGDETLFAHLMSVKAFVIGASRTHFRNASGLPDSDHYSTAYDLAVIGRFALTHPYVREMVATDVSQFHHPGYQQPLTITNTNALLRSYTGADGIKTGTTDAAGKCLVASATRDGRQLISVVLKSPDRQGDCARLLSFGFDNYHFVKLIDRQNSFKRLKVYQGEQPYVYIYPKQDLWCWMSEKRPRIEKTVQMNYTIGAPLYQGQTAGELNIYCEGKLLRTVELVYGQSIKKDGTAQRLLRHFLNFNKGNQAGSKE